MTRDHAENGTSRRRSPPLRSARGSARTLVRVQGAAASGLGVGGELGRGQQDPADQQPGARGHQSGQYSVTATWALSIPIASCQSSSAVPASSRIVQAAVKIVLEPVFEADFLPCSFGFRPGRSAHDALQVLIDEAWQGRRWVVETDIANCFSAIPQDKLMQAVEERISDQGVLKLLRAMLRAGVMEGGQVRREVTGAPQGGPASPLLCNIYLHRLDRVWDADRHGVLVRTAMTWW